MKTIAVIQARLGSTRLPGKVMFPLDGLPVLARILERLDSSTMIDEVIVATTDQLEDDVLVRLAQEKGASTYQGSETDVLGRLYESAKEHNADIVVRICADTPFVSYRIVDACVRKIVEKKYDYASTKLKRTFPVGYGTEVFTMESFEQVKSMSTEPNEREHVTVRYRKDRDELSRKNFSSNEFFSNQRHQNRGDLRLTLDQPADYRLIETVYSGTKAVNPSIESIIDYIDANGLQDINSGVEQKSMYDSS
jgi:spore coat polysaccharide biosynthesis protein SpsF